MLSPTQNLARWMSSPSDAESMKKDKISKKDLLLLVLVYVGLLAIVLILPENNSLLSGVILGSYAIVSFVVVERIR